MNNLLKLRMRRLWFLAAAALAACAGERLNLTPGGAIAAAPATYVAAVADAKPAPIPSSEYDNSPVFSLMEGGWGKVLGPKATAEFLISDLSSSGLFTGVEPAGKGSADVLITPAYEKAYVKPAGAMTDEYVLDLRLDVTNGSQQLLSKVYKRDWKCPVWQSGGSLMSQQVSSILTEFRGDLAQALGIPTSQGTLGTLGAP